MPYIDRYDRPEIDQIVDQLDKLMETPGDCNYAITRLLHRYLRTKTVRYHNINEVVGILECAKLEFYAMIARPYEQHKADTNGHVGILPETEGIDTKALRHVISDHETRVKQLESNGFAG